TIARSNDENFPNTTTELNFGALTQVDKGTFFFRTIGGGGIGGTPSITTTNVRFSGGLPIVGANGTGTQTGIVPFAASNVSNVNISRHRGLITYDATNGVQALLATDAIYFVQATTAFTAGHNNNFAQDVSGTLALSSSISINSLVVDGIYSNPNLTGSGTLTIASGAVAAFSQLILVGPTFNFGANTGYFFVGAGDIQFTSTSQITGSGGVVVSSLDTTGNGLAFSNSVPNGFSGGSFQVNDPAGILTIPGQISGPGDLAKLGTGQLRLSNNANNYQGNTSIQSGTLRTTVANVLPSTTIVVLGTPSSSTGGTLDLFGNSQAVAGIGIASGNTAGSLNVITSTAAATFTVNGSSDSNFSGVISGAGLALTKNGTGTLILGGTNTYGGVTQVLGGTLLVNVSIASATTVSSGAAIGGSGSVGGNVTLNSNASITPGSGQSMGTLTASSITLNGGARYIWEVNAVPASGTQGTNWDFLSVSGLANGSANSGTPFVIQIVPAGSPVTNFNNQATYSWTIATFGSVSGLTSSSFSVDSTGWTGLNDPGNGEFTASLTGNNLIINYSPTPEPGHVLLICVIMLGVGMIVRKRWPRAAAV
ncbi:MAG: autotransporter-associated beta strand repeat-containing protein, partial [Planctomycetes bacterium]|nr:autotransporter-associated beta strand repeat-containing protein [Planctomycetota bacterium]